MEADVAQHRRIAAAVGEAHVVVGDLAPQLGGRHKAGHVQLFPILADDLAHTAEGDQRFGHLHDQAAQVADGPDDPDDHARIGQVLSQGDGAVDGHDRAQTEARNHLQAAHDVGDGPVERVGDEQPFAAHVLLPVDLLELAFLELLAGKGLDHAHAAQVFLERAGELRLLLLVQLVERGDAAEEEERDDQHHRNDDDREDGQTHIDGEQRGKVHQEEHENAAAFDGLLGEEAADGVHVRRGALDQFTRLRLVVIGEAEPLDLVLQVVAQAQHDAFGRGRGQPPAQEGEHALDHRQPDETEHDQRQADRMGRFRQVRVDKVGQQQERHRARHCGHAQACRRAEVGAAEAGHEPPQAVELALGHGVFQVVVQCFFFGQCNDSHNHSLDARCSSHPTRRTRLRSSRRRFLNLPISQSPIPWPMKKA